jgi:hypothetical protein
MPHNGALTERPRFPKSRRRVGLELDPVERAWIGLFGLAVFAVAGCVPGPLYVENHDGGLDATRDVEVDRTAPPTDGGADTCAGDSCAMRCDDGGCAAGSCCGPAGLCIAGDAATACGSGFACVDCTVGNAKGPACVAGECGCSSPSDCPVACNAHVCSTSCSGAGQCKEGCCSGTECVTGNTVSACGSDGGSCSACPAKAPCLPTGVCGCTTMMDCPKNEACKDNACGTTCGIMALCNGGCCALSTSSEGTCEDGEELATCGTTGFLCANCGLERCEAGLPACLGSGHCGCS